MTPLLNKIFRSAASVVLPIFLLSLTSTADAGQSLTWAAPESLEVADWSGAGAWTDADGHVTAWQSGADARFAAGTRRVRVHERIHAGGIEFEQPDFVVELSNAVAGSQLLASSLTGAPTIQFSGVVGAGADSYPAIAAQLQRGLVLNPGQETRLSARLEPRQGGSPILSVRGAGSVVTFDGTWIGDTGSIISWLVPVENGHVIIDADADFRFIRDAFYTLQLWVIGDGTGTVELAEGFVADRTANATVPRGIGSMRFSNTTLISHHSQGLPIGYRPWSNDRTQANGHLAFENERGSRWIVRSNDQSYAGAVWIYRDMEIRTETNLTHTGVTERAPDYAAMNGWSVFGNVIRKTGPGNLILAGEQSYNPGSLYLIEQGAIVFVNDPSAGEHFSGGTRAGTLEIAIDPEGAAIFQAAARIASIESSGMLASLFPLKLMGVDGLWLEADSTTEITLSQQTSPAITVDYEAIIDGRLRLLRAADFTPEPGTEIMLLEAGLLSGEVSGSWQLDDQTGLGLIVHQDATTVRVVTTRRAGAAPGAVLLDETFADLDNWQDLSLVPRWGQPSRTASAFSTAGGAVQLIRSGANDTTDWTRYNNASGLKTFTAIDHQFDQPIERAGQIITLDARLRWETTTTASGEGGRFMIILNHDYPEGGLDLTPEGASGSKLADFSAAWWARPAYHLRIRNGTTSAASAFLQYGGGHTDLGEYEAYNNQYWLAGFISGAGGVAPGGGDDFPANSWTRTFSGIASQTYRNYRYIIYPDRQEVWVDANDNGIFEPEELQAVMPLPQTSSAPLYRYFDTIEGVRLFWNGISEGSGGDTGQVFVDALRITLRADAEPTARMQLPATLLLTNGSSVGMLLDARDSSSPVDAKMWYQWFRNGQLIAASPSPLAATRLPSGTHRITLQIRDSHGNTAMTEQTVLVTQGNLRPVARAGNDQNLIANERYLVRATVDGSGSTDADGEIVRYQWFLGDSVTAFADGVHPQATIVLPVGLHRIRLQVTDNEGAVGTDEMRIQVSVPGGNVPFIIYRENFSRPNNDEEMGPWEVGWELTRPDGLPVPSVKFDGNAHRSLSTGGTGEVYLPKINANPTGTEFDAHNATGNMWMNQMPFLNATPAEWMLWTEEFAIDTEAYEITQVQFHAWDNSPERVKNSLAVRIEDQWYLFWDGRVETRWSFFRLYTIPFATTGWYLFEPSGNFSIRTAAPAALPGGRIDAFGLYFFKDYGWHVNRIDNFTVFVRERTPAPPFLLWQFAHFSGEELIDDSLEATLWGPYADPAQTGLPNFARFALGIGPNDPVGLPQPQLDAQSNALLWPIPRNPQATNVDITVHYSTNLSQWQPAPAFTWHEPDGETDVGAHAEQDAMQPIWQLELPLDAYPETVFFILDFALAE